MAPRFSILLPTRNRARLLRLAIASVLSQTDRNFELLVVGDGCTDDTATVVAGFHDARIRWFDLPKAHGFGYANRNVALRQAAGAFIGFAADDDLLLPDHLERMQATLETSGAEWAYSRPLWVSTDGVVVPFASNLLNADELTTFLTAGNHIPASCVMYRRGCQDAYGYWPEDVPKAGDWRYWIRIIEGGGRKNFACSPVPTTLHFNAAWKTMPELQMGEVTAARALAANGVWWPASLKVPMRPGVAEQEIFFELIGRPGYVDALRRGAGHVVDRLAWIQLTETPLALASLHAELAQARTDLETARRELAATRDRLSEDLLRTGGRLDDTRTQLDVVLASASWRVTAPLRAFSRAIRGAPARPPGHSS